MHKVELGQIYIILNGEKDGVAQWAAISEDGYTLGHIFIPSRTPGLAAQLLGRNSAHAPEYAKHYPNGYELNYIRNINAPEHFLLLDHIRRETRARVREKVANKSLHAMPDTPPAYRN